MRSRDWRIYVDDMLDAIHRIERYLDGASFESFLGDEMRQDAVVRNFSVIGEAARHLPAEVEARSPGIPWAKMRAIRNVVVHDYAGVDPGIVWDTAQLDLPPLVPMLEELLRREP
jgi:uncharacterized protein with HEPN domain